MNDFLSGGTRLHVCTVLRVFPSGLINARSDRGSYFESINTVSFGADAVYQNNDRCVVISDGSQHFALGVVREPNFDDSGRVTTKNIRNDLAELTDAKALVADDKFGNQAKVAVSPGAGIVLDSGENALIHVDPGNLKVTTIADRQETVTMPFSMEADHDGVRASTSYKWRTTSDALSWDRDLGNERNDSLDTGPIVTAEIGPAPDVISIAYKPPGAPPLTTIKIDTSGGVEIESTLGKIHMTAGGQFRIGGGMLDADLLKIVASVMMVLQRATTLTMLGPMVLNDVPALPLSADPNFIMEVLKIQSIIAP